METNVRNLLKIHLSSIFVPHFPKAQFLLLTWQHVLQCCYGLLAISQAQDLQMTTRQLHWTSQVADHRIQLIRKGENTELRRLRSPTDLEKERRPKREALWKSRHSRTGAQTEGRMLANEGPSRPSHGWWCQSHQSTQPWLGRSENTWKYSCQAGGDTWCSKATTVDFEFEHCKRLQVLISPC